MLLSRMRWTVWWFWYSWKDILAFFADDLVGKVTVVILVDIVHVFAACKMYVCPVCARARARVCVCVCVCVWGACACARRDACVNTRGRTNFRDEGWAITSPHTRGFYGDMFRAWIFTKLMGVGSEKILFHESVSNIWCTFEN